MASSAVSSVIGSPLRTGSCLGFLSAAAVAAGISTRKERKVLKERKHARRARGVMRTRTRYSGETSLEKWRGDISITFRLTLRTNKSCWQQGLVWLKDSAGASRAWMLPRRIWYQGWDCKSGSFASAL